MRGMCFRKDSRHRRSILLRSTARAEIFLGTTLAILGTSLPARGKTVREKYVPCTLREPARGRRTKSACESRYFFGIFRRRASPGPCGGGGARHCGLQWWRFAPGSRESSRAYAFLAARFVSCEHYKLNFSLFKHSP